MDNLTFYGIIAVAISDSIFIVLIVIGEWHIRLQRKTIKELERSIKIRTELFHQCNNPGLSLQQRIDLDKRLKEIDDEQNQ